MGIFDDLGSKFGINLLFFHIYFSDYARSWLCRVLIADFSISAQVIGEKQEVEAN